MKLTNTLKNLVIESARFEILYNDNVAPSKKGQDGKPLKGVMDFNTLKELIFTDPTTRKPENFDIDGASINDMDNIKVGKYTKWIIKTYLEKNPPQMQLPDDIDYNNPQYKSSIKEYRRQFIEDLSHLKMLLTKYNKFKSNIVNGNDKDITKIKSVEQLSKIPVKLTSTIKDSNGKVIEKLEENIELEMYPIEGKKRIKTDDTQKANTNYNIPGAEVLKVGSEYTLIKIEDKGILGSEAASYFGGYDGGLEKGESNWCTAARGSKWSHDYRQDGPLYIIIANDDKGKVGKVTGLPEERYQIHFPSKQFRYRNQHGGNFPVVEYFNGRFSEFKEIFKHEFAKGLTSKGGDRVEIRYPDFGAGTFIALYGFEDLFNTLPDNIISLSFINTSNENIELDIPKSIERFTNLEVLLLQKIVKSIPSEIGKLKKLEYFSLPNNPSLTTLPDSIVNLTNLDFINLNGSNNVELPPKLKEVVTTVEDGLYWFNI